jgi:hypothetical protein
MGRYPDPLRLGWVPLLVLKLIVLAVPVWLGRRFWSRTRRRQLISDYLSGCRTKDPMFDTAVQRITAMTFMSKPESQWEVILEAVRQASDDDDLGHIAAGPIEGLLGRHGPAWIERVETQAQQDQKFARAITGVWKYTMNDDVWERVKTVKSLVPADQWLPAGLQELAKRPAN